MSKDDKVVERIREIRRNFGDGAFDEAVVECIEEIDKRLRVLESFHAHYAERTAEFIAEMEKLKEIKS